jgi:radical SAM protein with 4Fe4S-binding SPASM domain
MASTLDGCLGCGTAARLMLSAAMANRPLAASWELTHRCPLSCRHCYLQGAWTASEMPASDAFRTLETLARAGVLFLLFTGGEPTLHPAFWEIAARARRLGFCIQIYTGGSHLDGADLDRLAGIAPLNVEITVHSCDAAAHDAITRRPGSFLAAVASLKGLRERGVRTVLKVTVSSANIESLSRLRDLSGELGAVLRVGTEIVPSAGTGAIAAPDLLPARAKLAEYYRGLSPHVTFSGEPPPADAIPCGAGRSSLAIGPDGQVYPCVIWREPLGNILEKTFGEIWDGEAARRVRAIRFGDTAECMRCEALAVCRRCPGESWLRWRDPARPAEYNCERGKAMLAAVRGQAAEAHAMEEGGADEAGVGEGAGPPGGGGARTSAATGSGKGCSA